MDMMREAWMMLEGSMDHKDRYVDLRQCSMSVIMRVKENLPMLTGLLLQESLDDLRVLDLLCVTKTETWQVGNAAEGQPSVWTALSFEAPVGQADAIAEALGGALKARGWYINASTETHVYVIFPRKVFRYVKGDSAQRAAAKAYGRLIGIPEGQLDWGE
jgi:hypothetical protein